MESGAILDKQISASSIYSEKHAAHQARLNYQAVSGSTTGAWTAGANDANQWLDIDLESDHTVTRVATQGRADKTKWVTKYNLQYKLSLGQNSWFYMEHAQGQPTVKVKI